jgi:hypothetical protein
MTAQVTPIQVPLTNGVVRSFGHVRLEIAGLEFTGGFKSIKRSRVREREMPYSNSPDPIGKTLGENKYQCSAVVYYDWWANLMQTVEANFGPGYGDAPFNIYVSYVGVNLNVYTDWILNCTFDTTQADDQQGIAALTREIEFNPTKILFNGIEDLADPLVAPPQ